MLVAMAVLLPIILTYTAFVYRTFRGKISIQAAEE
jgi:cytochrome bd-type quinol oxidase subunit 2